MWLRYYQPVPDNKLNPDELPDEEEQERIDREKERRIDEYVNRDE